MSGSTLLAGMSAVCVWQGQPRCVSCHLRGIRHHPVKCGYPPYQHATPFAVEASPTMPCHHRAHILIQTPRKVAHRFCKDRIDFARDSRAALMSRDRIQTRAGDKPYDQWILNIRRVPEGPRRKKCESLLSPEDVNGSSN
jgi:hypothetical protein